MTYLNSFIVGELIQQAHDTSVKNGFWGSAPDESKHRNFGEAIALIHSECSEALEAHRASEGDERVVEELCDILIRTFDLLGSYSEIDVSQALIDKMNKNANRPYKHGKGY